MAGFFYVPVPLTIPEGRQDDESGWLRMLSRAEKQTISKVSDDSMGLTPYDMGRQKVIAVYLGLRGPRQGCLCSRNCAPKALPDNK